ncbi:aspartate carbamoyltransferase [Hydrogenophaga sp.]|uniref:aspartate carbamoyltransferase n=1 Tax=Hydrogenophaga sp. TaxID=1904254 RepID=UPI0025C24737|nr:aspartate carbamoyltransferase [Hydrogenophaga sp.]
MKALTALALATALLTGCTQSRMADHAGTGHTAMDHTAHMQAMASADRRAVVSARGSQVMPFSLAATEHVFTPSASGGVQQVVARNAGDAQQVTLVRQHLREIREQFMKGDFSGPSHIHGANMPGLAQLKAAQPGQLTIAYQDIPAGAELSYTTTETNLVAALHQWFNAQLVDHGTDARGGHSHHEDMGKR